MTFSLNSGSAPSKKQKDQNGDRNSLMGRLKFRSKKDDTAADVSASQEVTGHQQSHSTSQWQGQQGGMMLNTLPQSSKNPSRGMSLVLRHEQSASFNPFPDIPPPSFRSSPAVGRDAHVRQAWSNVWVSEMNGSSQLPASGPQIQQQPIPNSQLVEHGNPQSGYRSMLDTGPRSFLVRDGQDPSRTEVGPSNNHAGDDSMDTYRHNFLEPDSYLKAEAELPADNSTSRDLTSPSRTNYTVPARPALTNKPDPRRQQSGPQYINPGPGYPSSSGQAPQNEASQVSPNLRSPSPEERRDRNGRLDTTANGMSMALQGARFATASQRQNPAAQRSLVHPAQFGRGYATGAPNGPATNGHFTPYTPQTVQLIRPLSQKQAPIGSTEVHMPPAARQTDNNRPLPETPVSPQEETEISQLHDASEPEDGDKDRDGNAREEDEYQPDEAYTSRTNSHQESMVHDGNDRSRMARLFHSRGSNAKFMPSQSSPQRITMSDDKLTEKRIKEFLKPYKVGRQNGLDWFSTLLTWIDSELKRRDSDFKKADKQCKAFQASLGKVQKENEVLRAEVKNLERAGSELQSKEDEIRDLKNEMATAKTRGNAWYTGWQQCENKLKDTIADRDRFKGAHDQLFATHQRVQSDLQNMSTTNQSNLKFVEQLQQNAGTLQQTIRQLEQDIENYKQQISRVAENARKNEQQLQDHLQNETVRLLQEKEAAVSSLESQLEGERTFHAQELTQLNSSIDSKISAQTKQLKHSVDSLTRRIASYSTGSYNVIPDQTFNLSFQTLSQQVSNLVSCVPKPDAFLFDESLDPHNYLSRNGHLGNRSWPKFVRSICWKVFIKGFFLYPLGFGALGSQGQGYVALYQLYELFAVPEPEDTSGDIRTLPNDKETNSWRASTFDAILRDVRQSSNGSHDNAYSSMFRANVEQVTRELVNTLQHICSNRMDARAPAQISSIAYELGVLALEMGSQRARIQLQTCEYNDWVSPDELFKDENDSRGSNLQVDLMTQPCLRRIGDGREDLTSQRVIVQGNFVSLNGGY